MILVLNLTLFQLANVLLVMVFLFLAFKVFEQKWSYKVSKPYLWDQAIKLGTVSSNLKKTERSYRDKVRFYTIWLQIERLKKDQVAGAVAELGVYQGETAKMIHEMDSDRTFLLFDSFAGFNETDLSKEKSKETKYSTSNFSDTSLEEVKKYINGNENVSFYPGYFPDSTAHVPDLSYAFVHLDADLYVPTLTALHYFYPKLSPGGVIMIHDYNHTWDGVQKAVDEFSSTIPEAFVPIADWQGSVLLVKNFSNRK